MKRRDRLREQMKLATIDLVSGLLYYDRKEDEDLDRDDVEEMFANGWITADEIAEWFREELKTSAPNGCDPG